jgi:hypothetical protein
METDGLSAAKYPAQADFLAHREREIGAKKEKKEIVENAKKGEYTLGSMNMQLANRYCWYRFTWHPSGWRGAIL